MKNQPICLMLIIPHFLLAAAAPPGPWVQTLTKGNKKITKFHFYVHNTNLGPNATVGNVANASITATSPTNFGQVNVFDDPITAEPDINSEQVARVQGTAAFDGLKAVAVAINANFYITSGEYNRSTVVVAGRIPLSEPLREVPVIGGTGAFRLARGYVVTRLYSFDKATIYSLFEYTIYVITHINE